MMEPESRIILQQFSIEDVEVEEDHGCKTEPTDSLKGIVALWNRREFPLGLALSYLTCNCSYFASSLLNVTRDQ
jgi:hypothetical protein